MKLTYLVLILLLLYVVDCNDNNDNDNDIVTRASSIVDNILQNKDTKSNSNSNSNGDDKSKSKSKSHSDAKNKSNGDKTKSKSKKRTRKNKVEMNIIEDYVNGSLNFQWYKDYNEKKNKTYTNRYTSIIHYQCDKTEFVILDNNTCDKEFHMSNVYFHSVFDVSKTSSVALTVKQICRALSLCINKKNFRIVLNVSKNYNRDYSQFMSYKSIVAFLDSLSINFMSWLGNFDTYALTEVRMKSLHDVISDNDIIFQADTDEFPVFDSINSNASSVSKALIDMIITDKKCDAIHGKLLDAISPTRTLINVSWDKALSEQFTSYCDAKKQIEHANSNKLVLYRATHRPLPGNHRLRCESTGYPLEECNNHNNTFIPNVSKRPKSCKKLLKIKHYKYVWGIEDYLNVRAQIFKKAHIPWYKESLQALDYLNQFNGTICGKTTI